MNERIQELAEQAGMRECSLGYGMPENVLWGENQIEKFADLIRADEREACAKVCEGRIGGAIPSNEWWSGFKSAMKQCAEVIRERGNT